MAGHPCCCDNNTYSCADNSDFPDTFTVEVTGFGAGCTSFNTTNTANYSSTDTLTGAGCTNSGEDACRYNWTDGVLWVVGINSDSTDYDIVISIGAAATKFHIRKNYGSKQSLPLTIDVSSADCTAWIGTDPGCDTSGVSVDLYA